LSGNQVITTGHLEMQKVSFQNTGFAGTEYKGFIWKVLDDNVPVTGPLSFKSQQTSPSTCVNQTSASTCASAKCTRVPSASVAGDGKTAMGTVVYDEAYGINVSLPIPTRVGYEFIGRYSTFSSTDLPPTANPPSGRITETTLMTTASNHILYPRWKEKQKFPAFALNVAVNGGCKKVPGAPSGNGRQRIG
jgi:hypothetical protein